MERKETWRITKMTHLPNVGFGVGGLQVHPVSQSKVQYVWEHALVWIQPEEQPLAVQYAPQVWAGAQLAPFHEQVPGQDVGAKVGDSVWAAISWKQRTDMRRYLSMNASDISSKH